MENQRPNLNDPKEWTIVRDMYFNGKEVDSETIDSIEKLERIESKQRILNKNAR